MADDQPTSREYLITTLPLYHHFLVYVDGCTEGISESFTATSVADRLTLHGCIAAVHTVSSGTFFASVHLAIVEQRPTIYRQTWDHITEFSMYVNSGRLVVAGPIPLTPGPTKIDIEPGAYRFRVGHQHIESVLAAYYGGDTSVVEHIWITVWPEPYSEPSVLNRYTERTAQ